MTAVSSPTSPASPASALALSGLASGLDTTSIVNGLVAAESQPMQGE